MRTADPSRARTSLPRQLLAVLPEYESLASKTPFGGNPIMEVSWSWGQWEVARDQAIRAALRRRQNEAGSLIIPGAFWEQVKAHSYLGRFCR